MIQIISQKPVYALINNSLFTPCQTVSCPDNQLCAAYSGGRYVCQSNLQSLFSFCCILRIVLQAQFCISKLYSKTINSENLYFHLP